MAPGTRPLLGVQILSFSYSFRQKELQNNRLAHRLWELAPQKENPGSATAIAYSVAIVIFAYISSAPATTACLSLSGDCAADGVQCGE